jgi:hypothetical protein
MAKSKSEPSPNLLIWMICLLSSNTEIPVPSKVTRDGSFCDLNLKKTEDDIVISSVINLFLVAEGAKSYPSLSTSRFAREICLYLSRLCDDDGEMKLDYRYPLFPFQASK